MVGLVGTEVRRECGIAALDEALGSTARKISSPVFPLSNSISY